MRAFLRWGRAAADEALAAHDTFVQVVLMGQSPDGHPGPPDSLLSAQVCFLPCCCLACLLLFFYLFPFPFPSSLASSSSSPSLTPCSSSCPSASAFSSASTSSSTSPPFGFLFLFPFPCLLSVLPLRLPQCFLSLFLFLFPSGFLTLFLFSSPAASSSSSTSSASSSSSPLVLMWHTHGCCVLHFIGRPAVCLTAGQLLYRHCDLGAQVTCTLSWCCCQLLHTY